MSTPKHHLFSQTDSSSSYHLRTKPPASIRLPRHMLHSKKTRGPSTSDPFMLLLSMIFKTGMESLIP